MKKTKLFRIVTALLTLVLVFGAAFGVSALANEENEASATIISKNVDYRAELSLVFAVEAANLQDGDEVYLLVWAAERGDGNYTAANAAYRQESYATAEEKINGVSNALLFKTHKIPVDDLQKDFYIRTYIKRANGEEVYGELVTYSVEDYALQRLSEENVTEAQAELYYNVLRYALAANSVLPEDSSAVENNWVIFVANGMTFGEEGAKLATIWNGKKPTGIDGNVVTDKDGKVVENINETLAPGFYTVSPAN